MDVEKESREKGADGVVNFQVGLREARYYDAGDVWEKFASGTLVTLTRRIFTWRGSYLRFTIPGEFYYTIELKDLGGKVLDRVEDRLRSSDTIPTGRLADGIYGASFMASERSGLNG